VEKMIVGAIVVAAGSGVRLGAGIPKALVLLNGRPLVEWAAVAFAQHPDVGPVVVVAPPELVAEVTALMPSGAVTEISVVAGGASRQESVRIGLLALASEVDAVLVHDAARPLVPGDLISTVIRALADGARAVVPALPVADTIKRVDEDGKVLATLDRSELRSVQTPQGFERSVLLAAHNEAAELGAPGTTDDAGLLEAMGLEVRTVPGSERAFKITTVADLQLAVALAGRGAESDPDPDPDPESDPDPDPEPEPEAEHEAEPTVQTA
jgi:2-C-methyl-D-erythritol 4-phosphate cytidylyltransferase